MNVLRTVHHGVRAVAARTRGWWLPAAIALVVLVGAFMRGPMLDRPVWHDEIYNTLTFLSPPQPGATRVWSQDWQRQLVFHPPGVSMFYAAWIRLAGDGAVPLHVPALLASLVSLVMALLFATRFLPLHLSLLYALTLAVSGSHVVHSVSAVHAIFEVAAFQGALLALARYLDSRTRRDGRLFVAALVLCSLVFYHAAVLLGLSAFILWLRRRELRLPRWPFVVPVLLCGGLVIMVVSLLVRRGEGYPFWSVNTAGHLLAVARDLPFAELDQPLERHEWFRWLLLSMAVVGGALPAPVLPGARPMRWQRDAGWLRGLVVALCVVPFVAYGGISLLGPRFGEPRNFFYLLPLTLLCAFRAVPWVASTIAARRAAPMGTLIGLGLAAAVLLVGLSQPERWGLSRYAYRHLFRTAASIEQGGVIYVSPIGGVTRDSRLAESYYRRRLGMDERVQRIPGLDQIDGPARRLMESGRPFSLVRFTKSVGAPLHPVTTAVGAYRVVEYELRPGVELPFYWPPPRRAGRTLVQTVVPTPARPRRTGRAPTDGRAAAQAAAWGQRRVRRCGGSISACSRAAREHPAPPRNASHGLVAPTHLPLPGKAASLSPSKSPTSARLGFSLTPMMGTAGPVPAPLRPATRVR